MSTTEDLEDFLAKADRVHELITLLQSNDRETVAKAHNDIDGYIRREDETRDGFSRTCITKAEDNVLDPDAPNIPTDQDGFMRAIEDDAYRRSQNRLKKEEESKVYKEKGNAAYKKGHYRAAVEDYDRAIKLTGWHVTLYTNKAQAYAKLKEYDKAIAECDKAVYIEDNFTKGYIQKSNMLIAKECYADSVECLELCLVNCKDSSSGIINKYLEKAKNLLRTATDDKEAMENATNLEIAELEHLICQLGTNRTAQILISTEFLLEALKRENTARIFRAMGGIQVLARQLRYQTNHDIHVRLFEVLKTVLLSDVLALYSWIYLEDSWAGIIAEHGECNMFRMPLLLVIKDLVFEDEVVSAVFLDNLTSDTLMEQIVRGFSQPSTRSLTVLTVGRMLRNKGILTRFKARLTILLKCISDYLPSIITEPVGERKKLITGIAELSVTRVPRETLDKSFWGIFIQLFETLDNAGEVDTIRDLVTAGLNMTLESVVLADSGEKIMKVLMGMFKYNRVSQLLERVLERCPNALLTEDKGQFAALLKIIRERSQFDDELNLSIKLLTRTTAVSPLAQKWVVKYNVLETLLELLEKHEVTSTSPHQKTAILSNSALCVAHCFQDPAVCKKMELSVMDMMLKHAKAELGSAIQMNSAIAVARLATNNLAMLERLRKLNGIEILYTRYSEPCYK